MLQPVVPAHGVDTGWSCYPLPESSWRCCVGWVPWCSLTRGSGCLVIFEFAACSARFLRTVPKLILRIGKVSGALADPDQLFSGFALAPFFLRLSLAS